MLGSGGETRVGSEKSLERLDTLRRPHEMDDRDLGVA